MKEPKDLGVKIGTEEEVAWTTIKEKAEETIKLCKREIIVNTAIVDLAKGIIHKEKGK